MDRPDSSMSAAPTPPTPVPGPIHHAIDLATVTLLDVQRLRQRNTADTELVSELGVLEDTLRQLGEFLLQTRDHRS